MRKLRRAMVRPGRERLAGVVEVDETYWGAEEEGVSGRQTERKALIAVAAEERGRGLGRDPHAARAERIGGQFDALRGGVGRAGKLGAHRRLAGLRAAGEEGLPASHRLSVGRRKQASELLPRVHQAISLLKRWLLGTHQGAVSHEHLDYYLDEFVFRFNRRNSRSRAKLSCRLVQQAVAVDPTPYRSIVADWDAEAP